MQALVVVPTRELGMQVISCLAACYAIIFHLPCASLLTHLVAVIVPM